MASTAAQKRRARKAVLSLGTASFQALKGQQLIIRVRLNAKSRKALVQLRRFRVRANITVRDARGNATVKSYVFTLKAPKKTKR